MVINDLHVESICVHPSKTNAKLVIDANAVLAVAGAAQSFQPVAWNRRKIFQTRGLMKLVQLPSRRPFDGLEPLRELIVEQQFRFIVPKGADHVFSVYR